LFNSRQVVTQEGESLAKEKGYIFQEVSAKSGTNINNLFYQDIFTQIGRKFNLMGDEDVVNAPNMDNINDQPQEGGIKLDKPKNEKQEHKKKKCC
jgi:hypothetical protein